MKTLKKGFFSLSIQNEDGKSEYELSEWNGEKQYWLKNKDDEGLGVNANDLFLMFDRYFKDNF